ncbi:ABC transporter ATP-binding protein [Natranaerobius thermophilus]|uniref:Quaternary amine transport ATP-binding protein n=1 Tax=Natranaerobius thermophilus (strain ATCC BAA-1301 / DSM 18059 / JW/NM-WN-LF) TaxID=457570 RepID=B2A3U2_NATTJ|nr:ABC transporter ATP-binding protein [Natranaerobius thermophilus]ACB83718.1 glycine betaine/L-proline ABC transporter, ATPase subunit [Natranaerobius thermophilus JW/NM-WN-LF]
MIKFEDVSKTFPNADNPAVKNLNMEVSEGEITVLVGPSGCGKTTTMKMVNRIYEITKGNIYVDNQDIYDLDPIELRLNIGYVIQEIGLFPHMTIADNIATVLYEKKWPKEEIDKRVNELMVLMGLDPDIYKQRRPSKLSGGQRQRVGVARAMAANPPIMLMDEPFAAVDPITRARLQNEFLELQEKMKKTIIFVTHDINEAIKMGDKIAVMREGQIVQYDSPKKILQNPRDEFVEKLVGSNRAVKSLSLVKINDAIINQVVSLEENSDIEEIKQHLDSNINIALLKDYNGHVTGYVTDLDLRGVNSGKIKDFKKPYEQVLNKNDDLSKALSVMLNQSVYHVPVMDGQNECLGVITVDDVFKAVSSNDSQ